MARDTIENGVCKTNTGYRQVLVSSNMKLRPVLVEINSGYIPDRGTVQVSPRVGDLLFKTTWSSLEYRNQVFQRKPGKIWEEITEAGVFNLWKKLRKVHPWTNQFLMPHQGRVASYIPYEGRTIIEKNKIERITNFFMKYNLREFIKNNVDVSIIDNIVKSPKRGLNFNPVKNKDILDYIPKIKARIGSLVDIYTKDFILAVDRDGRGRELELQYTKDYSSNFPHTPSVYEIGLPIKEVITNLDDIKYIVKITKGAYVKNHYSYGYTIDIYDIT